MGSWNIKFYKPHRHYLFIVARLQLILVRNQDVNIMRILIIKMGPVELINSNKEKQEKCPWSHFSDMILIRNRQSAETICIILLNLTCLPNRDLV